MRFLHTGDIHLGMTPEAGTPWAREREDAISQTFLRILALAVEQNVDLVLIAGDLFHRPPLLRECKELNYHLSCLAPIPVVIIAGNHDYIRERSPYLSFPWAENVMILSDASLSSVYFENLHTHVHGLSFHGREIHDPLLDSLTAPDDDDIHILLAHGGDATHIPISYASLAQAGFDYVALGHIHQPRIFPSKNMAYCGSPEPLDRTELGAHGCILGEITEKGCQLSWTPLAQTQYRLLELSITAHSTVGEIQQHVKKELTSSPSDLFRLLLTGFRDSEISFDPDDFSCLGRIVEVIDKTEPEYNLDDLLANHANDLISHYIQALQTPTASELQKKALYYGLRALLNPESRRT